MLLIELHDTGFDCTSQLPLSICCLRVRLCSDFEVCISRIACQVVPLYAVAMQHTDTSKHIGLHNTTNGLRVSAFL